VARSPGYGSTLAVGVAGSYDPRMAEILGVIATAFAVLGGAATGIGWLRRKRRELIERKTAALAASAAPPYPVRFRCWELTEFHPSGGPQEGLVFEVFNHSDHEVRVKGFGLDITLVAGDNEWHEFEQAAVYPQITFPARLVPHDAIEGSIHTESLDERLWVEGNHHVASHPYVDIVGYGQATTQIDKEPPQVNLPS
jgi:hypothetical protein